MIKTFTQNDVMRYVYRETSAKENEELENAFIIDATLKDFYNDMIEIIDELEKVKVKAPDRVVKNILEYSKSKYLEFQQE